MSETPAEQQAAPIQVLTQYVRDLSFENPNAPESLVADGEQPAVQVSVDVTARRVQDNLFEVALAIGVDAKRGGKPMFLCEVTYAGAFVVQGVAEEHLHPFLLIEGPRLLFPFARAIVNEAVRDGGFPPIMLQPIDFAALYRSRQAQPQGQA
ncbi:MAG: protein-export chaperone SecB [Thalassobaculales bacterium]